MSGVVAAAQPPSLDPKQPASCRHRYLILWTDTWHCCDCKVEIDDALRIAEEEKEAARAEQEDASRPLDSPVYSHNLGVTVGWLVEWTEANKCWNLPTWKVQHQIIKPATESKRCRFADTISKEFVGAADIFVSHCWGSSFGDLVAALTDCCDDTQRVWIDIFAVRQWPGNVADLDFGGVVSRCKCVVLVCVKLDLIADMTWFEIQAMSGNINVPAAARSSVPFFRVWCLVELQAARTASVPIIMQGGGRDVNSVWPAIKFVPSYDMLAKMEYLVSVEQADATVEADKIRILQDVRLSPGGAPALNRSVQASIVAARLSHAYPTVKQAAVGNVIALSNIRNTGKKTANILIVAAAGGGYDHVFQLLLDIGADIDPPDDNLPQYCYTKTTQEGGGEMETITALMAASKAGNINMVKRIIHLGARVDRKNTRDHTALMCATAFGHTNVAALLLQHGANVEAKDSLLGRTPLMFAASHQHNESCIGMLCNIGGANIDEIDNSGRSALDIALIRNVKDAIFELLKHRGTLKAPVTDNRGCSALFHAVRHSDSEVVKHMLVNMSADPNITCNDGTSPLMVAVEKIVMLCASDSSRSGRERVIKLLLDAGAKVETEDEDQETALALAKEWENLNVVDLLEKYL
eukprot:Stramenopile-MAST_4_protein_1120